MVWMIRAMEVTGIDDRMKHRLAQSFFQAADFMRISCGFKRASVTIRKNFTKEAVEVNQPFSVASVVSVVQEFLIPGI